MAAPGTDQGSYLLRESRSTRQRLAGILNQQLRTLGQHRWGKANEPALEHEKALLLTAMEALLTAPWQRPLSREEKERLLELEE